MGKDGAHGLLNLKKLGAMTFCESEESAVVFGMPKAAIELGAATTVGNLTELKHHLHQLVYLTKLPKVA